MKLTKKLSNIGNINTITYNPTMCDTHKLLQHIELNIATEFGRVNKLGTA